MNYQQASRLRKESLLNLIGDRLIINPNLSLGSAVKSSISDKVKAKLTGFKENLDPLNITRKITGGSTLGPVLVGKLLGRSSEDISYFSGIARNKTRKSLYLRNVKSNVENIRRGEGLADALGKLYTLFKKIVKEEKLERELQKDLLVQQEKDATRKHKEIIKALKKLSVPEKLSFIDKVKAKNEKQELPKNEPRTSPGGISFPSFSLPKLSTATKIVGGVAGVTATTGASASIIRSQLGKGVPTGITVSGNDVSGGQPVTTKIGNQVRTGGTISWRNNNPGNIVYSPFAKDNGAIGYTVAGDGNPTAVFPTLEDGINAQKKLLRGPGYNNLTIGNAAYKWTGHNASPESSYAKSLAQSAGAFTTTEISKLSDSQLVSLIYAQAAQEGFKTGKINGNEAAPVFASKTPIKQVASTNLNTTTLQNTNINQGQKINSLSVALNNTTKEQSSVIIVQKNINNINNGTDTTQIVNRPVQNRESALMQAQRG